MRNTIFLLAVFGFILTTAFAAANMEDLPWKVTDVRINSIPDDVTSFRFTISDPEPLSRETAICTGSWMTNATDLVNPQGYAPCLGDTTFGWQIESFNSIRDFSFEIIHSFWDPDVKGRVRNFAIATFNDTMINKIQCTPADAKILRQSCQQVKNTTIMAPILRTTAKRR